MSVAQIGNKAGGDIVAGSKYETKNIYVNQPTSLSRLYQILRNDEQASSHKSNIAEILQHFCSSTASPDIRGLEAKLKDGGREDLLSEALLWKQRASMLIMQWQTSPVTHDIITHILSKIHTEFTLHVKPAIEAGRPRDEVDQLISEKVLAPTDAMLGENDLQITYVDLLGMLFYLGGNCHIRWDKC